MSPPPLSAHPNVCKPSVLRGIRRGQGKEILHTRPDDSLVSAASGGAGFATHAPVHHHGLSQSAVFRHTVDSGCSPQSVPNMGLDAPSLNPWTIE